MSPRKGERSSQLTDRVADLDQRLGRLHPLDGVPLASGLCHLHSAIVADAVWPDEA
jgi:hypothetical protein